MALLPTPRSLVGIGVGLARTSVRAGVSLAVWSEKMMVEQLAARLDAVRAPMALQSAQPPASTPTSSEPEDLTRRMSGLLHRATHQSTHAGRQELFSKILDQLVPDEARILAALATGGGSPVLHVHARTLAGTQGAPLWENACLVGKSANLAVPKQTPSYVTHLLTLGLVELRSEDSGLDEGYQILSADLDVLKAIKKGSRGPVPPILERRTLVLSDLGRDLWDASTQTDQERP